MTKISSKFIEEVFGHISLHNGCRSPDIQAALGRCPKAVQRAVKALADAGRIQVTGASTNRRYGLPGSMEQDLEVRVYRMICRPQGAASREILAEVPISMPGLSRVYQRLQAAGKIEMAKASKSSRTIRWFQAGKVNLPQPKNQVQPSITLPKLPKPEGKVIVPSNVKRSVGPSVQYDPRFQVPPDTRVIGGFRDMGIGRYLNVERM